MFQKLAFLFRDPSYSHTYWLSQVRQNPFIRFRLRQTVFRQVKHRYSKQFRAAFLVYLRERPTHSSGRHLGCIIGPCCQNQLCCQSECQLCNVWNLNSLRQGIKYHHFVNGNISLILCLSSATLFLIHKTLTDWVEKRANHNEPLVPLLQKRITSTANFPRVSSWRFLCILLSPTPPQRKLHLHFTEGS